MGTLKIRNAGEGEETEGAGDDWGTIGYSVSSWSFSFPVSGLRLWSVYYITPTIGMRVPTTKPKVKIKAQKEALTKMNNLKSISYYRHMKPIFLKSL